MKAQWLLLAALLGGLVANSQTLFTYGKKAVSKQEFEKAFNKNPTADVERSKALSEYLNLYINYKLKVQSGYDEKLYESASFQLESKNFTQQIAENIIKEEVGIKALISEAFTRSQKDIHAAQVFIPTLANSDTVKALQQITEAYNALQTGADFGEVAAKYTTDENVKKAKGDLGFITVFTLQYAFESQIYGLQVGQFSKPYRSKYGYHIFKNVGERPALGKRKVAQLLLVLPPQATNADAQKVSKLADSVYNMLLHGETFEAATAKFSNDARTANSGGVLPEISVGQFDANYEANIYNLKKVGDITKPFETTIGYHIIKLLDILPVGRDINDPNTNAQIKQQVDNDARLLLYKKAKLATWLQLTKYKPSSYKQEALWVYTDSALANTPLNSYQGITDTTTLFSFAKQNIKVAAWLQYLRKEAIANRTLYSKAFNDFVDESCINYYTANLVHYNPTIQQQVKEFDEANLLFAAMDAHVWGKGGTDIAGLKTYYSKHAQKYQWANGVSALVFTCKSKILATEIAAKIKVTPKNWRSIVAEYGVNCMADSGRFEQASLPVKATVESKVGFTSAPEDNLNEDFYTFVYVTAVHTTKEQRSFEDAKGMVINDYQNYLEQQWLDDLKKKYPITVNTAVFKTIN
ncbi:MAG: peptidylprolyl isomerase [Flavobacterium sp.]|nr:peptidylprolyl isomerase [Flavobacterium sp.]